MRRENTIDTATLRDAYCLQKAERESSVIDPGG